MSEEKPTARTETAAADVEAAAPEAGASASAAEAPDASAPDAPVRIVPPPATNEHVRKSMQGNKRRDTTPELKVRAMLRELGYPGYRLDWKKAPGHPDIAYPGRKIALFINGCFWHRCPVCNPSTPKNNQAYWEAKFKRNVERDAVTRAALEELGWTVVVIWEHELKKAALPDTRRALYDAVKRAGDPPYDERFPPYGTAMNAPACACYDTCIRTNAQPIAARRARGAAQEGAGR